MLYDEVHKSGLPYLNARVYDDSNCQILFGNNLGGGADLTGYNITAYGLFTYNPDSQQYITDPYFYQLDVDAYGFE